MSKCDKCGKDVGSVVRVVRNEYPTTGFPHNTTKFLCEKCKAKFEKYITKCYENFFNEKVKGDKE